MKRSLRLFFAIKPAGLTEVLQKNLSHLREQYSHSFIRWIPIENLHVTLQFLAAVKVEDLDSLIKNANEVISSFPAFEIEFKEVELFPSKIHPRVISLNMSPENSLSALAKEIGSAITSSGYEIEKRSFRGHLTLARLNKPTKDFALKETHIINFKIKITEVVLFESKPGKAGSVYLPLKTISLSK